MLSKIREVFRVNGIGLGILIVVRKIINKLYSLLVLRDSNLCLDYTSKVEGLRNIVANGRICAGKYFWIATYEKYYNQDFNPKIIFKGNFTASDFCHIGATNYVEIGENVLFGSKVYVTDHGHGLYKGNGQSLPTEMPVLRLLDYDKKVVIGDNVWLGDNVVVLPDVIIGKGCIIGANSVVTKDVPDYSIAIGIPARVIKRFDFKSNKWVRV